MALRFVVFAEMLWSSLRQLLQRIVSFDIQWSIFSRFCRKKFSPLWSPKLWTMHLISVSDNPADVEFFLTRWRPWPNLNLRVCISINHLFSFVMLATHIYFPDLVSICVVYMKLLVLFKSFWDCFCILQGLGLGLGRRPSKQTCARVMNISCDF